METIIFTTLFTVVLTTLRHAFLKVRSLWGEARWYEKLAMCLLFVPIPGPIDEIIALLVMRRIIARR